jgi:hypothetical protein
VGFNTAEKRFNVVHQHKKLKEKDNFWGEHAAILNKLWKRIRIKL